MVRSGWVCPLPVVAELLLSLPPETKAHARFCRAALAQDPGDWAWLQPARLLL